MINEIILFEEKTVRRARLHDEWWFVISDVVAVLTESVNPSDYLKKLRKRDESLSNAFKGGGQLVPSLGIEFDTAGGRQMMQCWNTMGVLRLIQSIPSPKAEPFKIWLAKVGGERINEIENPELAQERMKSLYEQKGYSKEWIDKRLRGIAVRQDLTDEWKKRGIKEQVEFAILTNEISKATFGKTIEEYKKFKDLKKENLRDHMTDLELIFNMLGEASTAEIERKQNPRRFKEHVSVSRKGGEIAKIARKELEKETGQSILSQKNYLTEKEKISKEKRKKKEILEVVD